MSSKVFKLFNLVLLLALVLSACTHIYDPGLPAPEAPQSPVSEVSTSIEPDTPDQPVFGEEIYNAMKACPDLALNQICLGHGSITGDISSSAPGERADLSTGQHIAVTSTSLDDYSVVVARLQAPGVDSDFDSLLVLAVGTVDVRFDEIFFGRDETNQNLPRIQFSSSNVTDGETQLQGGIVIINESDEDLLSVEVNGVGLTLGSAAVITSQPNGEMKVHMRTGTVVASANGETIPASAGEKVIVPMTTESKPSAVLQVSLIEDDLLTPLVPPKRSTGDLEDDLLTPLVPPPGYYAKTRLGKFEIAYDRCVEGDARQVYRVMYFARLLLDNPNLNEAQAVREILGEQKLNEVREKVKKCATFELILDSTLVGSSAISWQTKVHGEVLQLQFDEKGNLVAPVQGNIVATEFEPNMPVPPGCAFSALSSDGELAVIEGSKLGIYYNTMKIRLNIWAENSTQNVVLDCPNATQNIPLDWDTYFIYLHSDLLKDATYGHVIEDWEYLGGEIYAESYYLSRSGAIEDGDVYMDTAFVLRHAPQK